MDEFWIRECAKRDRGRADNPEIRSRNHSTDPAQSAEVKEEGKVIARARRSREEWKNGGIDRGARRTDCYARRTRAGNNKDRGRREREMARRKREN